MLKDEYGNFIYELTDEDNECIIEHRKFYKDLFEFGNEVLKCGFSKKCEEYELTIYSCTYRILELIDTLKIMTDNSLINSGLVIVRSLFENVAQLCYICSDNEKIEKRAIIFQLFDIKRTCQNSELFKERIKNYSCYLLYIDYVENSKRFNNWYSYCEGKMTTLKDICKKSQLGELYEQLYRPLSLELHGLTHMETNIVIDDKFNFKPFRMFENHTLLLNCILSIMIPCFNILIEMYGHECLKTRWHLYEYKAQDYIKKNRIISENFRIFNPMDKWF